MVKVKRDKPCSGCGAPVEVEEIPGVHSYDLAFCSMGCHESYWRRNLKLREEAGLPPLRNEDGSIFKIEG